MKPDLSAGSTDKLDRADAKLKRKYDTERYWKTCIEANVCPYCGTEDTKTVRPRVNCDALAYVYCSFCLKELPDKDPS